MNKKIPGVKKSINKSLTHESLRITKGTLLGLTAGITGLGGIANVDAAFSLFPNNGYSTSTNPEGFDPFPPNSSVPNNGSNSRDMVVVTSNTCSHASGVVNGHFSTVPTINSSATQVTYTKTHSNHSSHSSHSSGGWC
ncbi:hypothetical protein LAT59_03880 [Candidatus Gracilibacteria bacterium]|nr:hypothetical protein [Candidatus Gracilibacteria bacterium]